MTPPLGASDAWQRAGQRGTTGPREKVERSAPRRSTMEGKPHSGGKPMSAPGSLLHYLRRLLRPAQQPEISDSDLLRRFATARDELAFSALVERHGPMVLSV